MSWVRMGMPDASIPLEPGTQNPKTKDPPDASNQADPVGWETWISWADRRANH